MKLLTFPIGNAKISPAFDLDKRDPIGVSIVLLILEEDFNKLPDEFHDHAAAVLVEARNNLSQEKNHEARVEGES
jgi:hypothetical protein